MAEIASPAPLTGARHPPAAACSQVTIAPDYSLGPTLPPGPVVLKVWDLDTGLAIATFHCDGSAPCCAFADDHRIVAGDEGGRVYFLVIEEGPHHGHSSDNMK